MKAIGLAAAIAALGACAEGYGYGYGGPVGYAGYYDDYYGPVYDGYWGGDGAFYYSPGPGRPYARDDRGHFRHDAASGFHGWRGHGHGGPPPGHDHP
jgi:hypothetical protein